VKDVKENLEKQIRNIKETSEIIRRELEYSDLLNDPWYSFIFEAPSVKNEDIMKIKPLAFRIKVGYDLILLPVASISSQREIVFQEDLVDKKGNHKTNLYKRTIVEYEFNKENNFVKKIRLNKGLENSHIKLHEKQK